MPVSPRYLSARPEIARPAKPRLKPPAGREPGARGFAIEPLRSMAAVGAVTAGRANIWVRSERPGRVTVRYRPLKGGAERAASLEIDGDAKNDRTGTVVLPGQGERALDAGTAYTFRALHTESGDLIGEGRFETAPRHAGQAPEAFSVAIMSCNQPFDDEGRPVPEAAVMLRAADRCLEQHSTKYVLTLGDQVYTDYPSTLSLFDPDYFASVAPSGRARRSIEDCTADEVRQLLHERYRCFWNLEGWRNLHARYACLPILDDHDLVDNWGSVPAHSTPAWQSFIEGARAAYHDYQSSRVHARPEPGADFDFEIEYGPAATYVLDLRSNRRVGRDCRIYKREQLERLVRFLERNKDKDVLMLALSVPAIHLPRWGAQIAHRLTRSPNEDFADRWSTAGQISDRDQLLWRLHEHQQAHPSQRVLLLSGDIHIACAHRIIWEDGTEPLLQFVSSGITNRADRRVQLASKYSILANRRLKLGGGRKNAAVRLLRGEQGCNHNPYTKLNLGLVEFKRNAGGRYEVRYSVHGHRGDDPVCVYRSRWL